MKKITIVTVCLNSENEIEKTIQSVLRQRYDDFEYIIKDGGSTDGTLQIIKKYLGEFDKKGIIAELISTNDAGIFDAMNIGLNNATGKWINFLNAGDEYFSSTVLADIALTNERDDADIIYGHTMCRFVNGSKMVFVQNHLYIEEGIYQQACFIKKEILQTFKFDIQYSLLADYDLLIKLKRNNYKFIHLNTIVGIYDRNGISKKEYSKFFKQMNIIKVKYGIPSTKITIYKQFIYKLKTLFNKKAPMLSDWLYAFNTLKRSKQRFKF